ncbi:hypothetical protein B6U81_04070 [Thermoplasmatales archaeon ex4484_30]|nr:MAG: hypothetical protein B6U81_04070 [Thermoplasmatales archaeon ex4484_30]
MENNFNRISIYEIVEVVEILQSALAPIVILSSAGLISLSVQQRYGRVIDRIRIFHETMAKGGQWRKIAEEQIDILIRRGGLLRNAMFFLMTCIMLAVLATFSLSIKIIFDIGDKLVIIFFFSSLVSLFISVAFAIVEIFISYNAVLKEDENVRKI